MAAGVELQQRLGGAGHPGQRDRAPAATQGATEDFHIGGCDASGVVWAVGDEVTNVKVGDDVVIPCAVGTRPWVQAGDDPMFSALDQEHLGLRDELGQSFAQFTRVQAHQCLPKPPHLTWEQAAAPTCWSAPPPTAC